MASIIDEDQSYCIPRRSIFDNLFLVRDLLHLTEIYGLDVGLLSLDQEKAFDRVDYKYLFNTCQPLDLENSSFHGFRYFIRMYVAC